MGRRAKKKGRRARRGGARRGGARRNREKTSKLDATEKRAKRVVVCAVIGDAAFGLPFFRALNDGLLCATHLSRALESHLNLDGPTKMNVNTRHIIPRHRQRKGKKTKSGALKKKKGKQKILFTSIIHLLIFRSCTRNRPTPELYRLLQIAHCKGEEGSSNKGHFHRQWSELCRCQPNGET